MLDAFSGLFYVQNAAGTPLAELTALPQNPWLVGRGSLPPSPRTHPALGSSDLEVRPFGPRASSVPIVPILRNDHCITLQNKTGVGSGEGACPLPRKLIIQLIIQLIQLVVVVHNNTCTTHLHMSH